MKDHPSAMLGSLPSEILQHIFYFTTPATFFQLIQVNRKFFGVASESRELVLHHLRHLPGKKLGLDDRSISTSDLFLIFRQRATAHLYGVNFSADCRNLEPSSKNPVVFDPRASCLTADGDSCVVFRNSLRIKLNLHSNAAYGDTIESPYADGRAKIIQAVQKTYYVSVLYAWEPPEKSLAEDTSHPEPKIPLKVQDADRHGAAYDPRDGLRYRAMRGQPKTPSPSAPRVRYHLLHYDLYRSDKPVFFHIPTHKSLRGYDLVPVHLAVHNRLQCAILWDLPDTVCPTTNATVCLYKGENLPLNEPGNYDVWVIYPFDHPAPNSRPGVKFGAGEISGADSDPDNGAGGSSNRRSYTYTKNHQPSNNGGRNHDYDADLRFLHYPLKPRSISLFNDGRRLSLYAPGSITPYTTLLANEPVRTRMHPSNVSPSWPNIVGTQWPRSLCRLVRRMNQTWIRGHRFALSMPFFSKHDTIVQSHPGDPDSDEVNPEVEYECVTNMLCLATGRIPSSDIAAARGDTTGSGPEVLSIVQIRLRKHSDDCRHSEFKDDLPTGLPRPPRDPRSRRTFTDPNVAHDLDLSILSSQDIAADDAASGTEVADHSEHEVEIHSDSDDDLGRGTRDGTEVRVVARLWGWNAQDTSLSGAETVQVSPMGERIAIAQWDKVLIYALDPDALCEEAWDDGADSVTNNGSESSNHNEPGHESDVDFEDEDEDDDVASFPGHVETDEGLDADGDVGMGDASDVPTDPIPLPEPAQEPFMSLSTTHRPPPPAPASVPSSTSTSTRDLGYYYPHVKDRNLGCSYALLRPVVLKMDAGAVVRKMCWGIGRWRQNAGAEGGSNDEEDEFEDPNTEEREDGATDEVAGNAKEKDKEAGGIEISGTEDLPRPASQRADGDGDGGQDSVRPSREVEMGNSRDQPRASSSFTPSLQTNSAAARICADIHEQRPRSVFGDDVPPPPFPDMKLGPGQIKHICRPSDYDVDPDKMSPTASNIDTDKVIIDSEDDAKGAGVHNQATTTPGLDDGGPGSPESKSKSQTQQHQQQQQRKRNRRRKPRVRIAENELVVMTDRGIQIWDLSAWGRGRRLRDELVSDNILL
ncbi:hypothetical protein PV04_06548 [Phialophora macrospora]|uniref:F-box domain-containing protein n=1 Tax=Phialophora macrospora TaxID=1851006 RepID=A0A0D2FGT7_9EURO|nr:hypothetical protein PV04_06548 [Phialophora macrospora]